MKSVLLLVALLTFIQCKSTETESSSLSGPVESFGEYWYGGKAELNYYKLTQARYGELRSGHAIFIFVTEPFLLDQQVKSESGSGASTTVLKLNAIKRFTTGIYDYSVMGSSFTPVSTDKFPRTLKHTMSMQDWCGQVWSQLNYKKGSYHFTGHSYFETENEQSLTLEKAWLEDELMTKLRINPDDLPQGSFELIPAASYLRFKHLEPQVVDANAVTENYIGSDFPGDNLKQYRVEMPALERTLTIIYEADFPFKIAGWTDRYNDGGRDLTTVGRLENTLMDPYWQHNAQSDINLRRKLGIED